MPIYLHIYVYLDFKEKTIEKKTNCDHRNQVFPAPETVSQPASAEITSHPVSNTQTLPRKTCNNLKATPGLTKGLQTGLDELLPGRPFGEVPQSHGRFAWYAVGWIGFVESVGTARGRNLRLGAASRAHSP